MRSSCEIRNLIRSNYNDFEILKAVLNEPCYQPDYQGYYGDKFNKKEAKILLEANEIIPFRSSTSKMQKAIMNLGKLKSIPLQNIAFELIENIVDNPEDYRIKSRVDPNPIPREAIFTLGKWKLARANDKLIQILKLPHNIDPESEDLNSDLIENAIFYLNRNKVKGAIPDLIPLLTHHDDIVVISTIDALGSLKAKVAKNNLIALFGQAPIITEEVHTTLLHALRNIMGRKAIPIISEDVYHRSDLVRHNAQHILEQNFKIEPYWKD